MIKTNFKTTLRYLWKNRLFTFLNVLGLAVGISACWLIFVIVNYESRFNKNIPDRDRIFQVTSHIAGVPRPMVEFVKHDIPGVELVVPVHAQSMHSGKGDAPNAALIDGPKQQIATNGSYFDLVPHQWLTGSKSTALNAPNKVVLTQRRANQYFPGMDLHDIYGQTVIYNDSVAFVVSGIVADLPYESSFEWQEFFQVEFNEDHSFASSWNAIDVRELLYVKLASGVSSQQVAQQINAINTYHNKENFAKYQYTQMYTLLPLSEFHYAADIGGIQHRTVDKAVLYGLMGVATFLILLAIINYINLSTAQLPQRALEIGIRKTLGSNPRQLIGRFLIETLAITFIAVLFSIAISEAFSYLLADFIPPGLSVYDHIGTKLLFLVALILVLTLIAGIYPGWLITRVRTVSILKQKSGNVIGGFQVSFRKALVIFQFVIAMVFISCSIIIGQQLRFTLKKDMGFDYDVVLSVNVPHRIHQRQGNGDKPLRMKQVLQQYPEIASVSLGDLPMDKMLGHTTFFHQSDTGTIEVVAGGKYIDEDYLDVFGMDLIAGRNIDLSKGTPEYILNEAAIKAFGFASPDDAVGETLISGSGTAFLPIAGVVRDFHQGDFRNEIEPLVFLFGHHAQRDIHVKLERANPSGWGKAISKIETEWNALYPDVPFEFRFYEDFIAQLYHKDRQTATLANVATGITIFISCLGLFGLVTLMAFQRTKEIGIRKVLGASIAGIVVLLSKDFIKLVFIAVVLASPIAWWAMNNWLEDFAYRIAIQWWMFAVAGLAAIGVALLTVSWQAIRAAVANPVDSMRDE